MKNYFILMMGGSGTRFGASIPKQFVQVYVLTIIFIYLKQLINAMLAME